MEALLPLGVQEHSWSKGWNGRVYLGITFIVRYWESNIPATFKPCVVFVWEYSMQLFESTRVSDFIFWSVLHIKVTAIGLSCFPGLWNLYSSMRREIIL